MSNLILGIFNLGAAILMAYMILTLHAHEGLWYLALLVIVGLINAFFAVINIWRFVMERKAKTNEVK